MLIQPLMLNSDECDFVNKIKYQKYNQKYCYF